MRKLLLISLSTFVGSFAFSPAAWALCAGPVASPAQLARFDNNSPHWLRKEPSPPPYKDHDDLVKRAPTTKLVIDTMAVGNAAIGSKDVRFPAAVQTLLATASAVEGAYVGEALASLGTTCTSAEDERYVTSIATAIASSQNAAANAAYGEAVNAAQTAATGGGGGGGGGDSGGGGTQGFDPAGFFPDLPSDTDPQAPNQPQRYDNITLIGGGGSGGSNDPSAPLTGDPDPGSQNVSAF